MLTKDDIIRLLQTNDRAVSRALTVLTSRQTHDERVGEQTRYLNGRGFRPCHARMGTSMSTFFEKRGYLSPKQIAYWRARDKSGAMRIGIYAGQLLEEAEIKRKTTRPQLIIVTEPADLHRTENADDIMNDSSRDTLDEFISMCRS